MILDSVFQVHARHGRYTSLLLLFFQDGTLISVEPCKNHRKYSFYFILVKDFLSLIDSFDFTQAVSGVTHD